MEGISKSQRTVCISVYGWSVERHGQAIAGVQRSLTRHGRPEIFNTDQAPRVESSGRRNTMTKEVAMGIREGRLDRSGRAPLMSPGRPPVAGRYEQQRFWAAIAAGMASEDAAIGAGVPQAIGTRWFRKAGGMPPAIFRPTAKPLSGRYLSFTEREELAILRAQGGGLDYRATTAQWHADRSARRPKPVVSPAVV